MVDRKPASFSNTFVVYRQTTEVAGSQKLVYTLQHYGVSPIVLIYGCAHWIVVCGVQTDVNPATGPYTIEGFWINNPVHEANEPHAAGDVACSGGGHGIENQWVSYATWRSTYFTGCNYDSTDGSLQFLSVCDPDVPKIAVPRQLEPVRYFNGRSIIEPRQVADPLEEGDSTLFASPDGAGRQGQVWNATPGPASRCRRKVLLHCAVERGRRVVGYAQVDALYGNLESLFTLKRPAAPFESDTRKIEQQLAGVRIELPKEKGRFLLAKGKFKVDKHLVWRPCRQAYSPHLPFGAPPQGRSRSISASMVRFSHS